LCITHALPGGRTHFSPLDFRSFDGGDWFRPTTVQQCPKFVNLNVYATLLGFKAFDGGSKDFSSESL
jgi:hypothetical protein